MFPTGTVSSGRNTQVLASVSQSFYADIVNHPAVHAQVESIHRICCSRRQQMRPPTRQGLSTEAKKLADQVVKKLAEDMKARELIAKNS